MMYFSTLFDHNYLSRGLALYDSLKQNCKDKFQLYILALDDIAYDYLNKANLDSVIIQSLADIKDMYPVLTKLQEERTRAEFSWTLSSFSIQFFIKKYNLESCIYVDSDVFFFNNPKRLLDELTTQSVLITPHKYTPIYDQSSISGKYCVQFMYFKNDKNGNEVLEWWRQQCEICCTATPVDGKFGDQKYLDDWLSRFPSAVYECNNLGCGIAPWNVQQYEVEEVNGRILIIDKITKLSSPLFFYHFHGLKQFLNNENSNVLWYISDYSTDESIKKIIYKAYINRLLEIQSDLPDLKIPQIELQRTDSLLKLLIKTIIFSLKNIIKGFLLHRNYKYLRSENKKEINKINYQYIEIGIK